MRNVESRWGDVSLAELNKTIQKQGCAVIRGFFTEADLKPIWFDVDRLTESFSRGLKLNARNPDPRKRDQPLVRLIQTFPHARSALYDRLQQMPALLALPSHAKVRSLAESILGSTHLGVWPRIQMRLDMVEDQVNLIQWHHDYVYNQGTPNSYTFWIPVVDLLREMGPVTLALRSHEMENVEFIQSGNGQRFNLNLSDKDVGRLDAITPPTYEAGDLVVMHSKLLHTGNLNLVRDRARLTALFRIQDLNNLDLFAHVREACA